ncbi:hypothetical protein J1N35_005675 [Gossypium stocksii]|uniref:Uncharacterized protein n=1 Tax=Gossypium stocksii TaxID=47602 RepID=A0A9D3WFR7_9ROSI|nr:hypothetical protein J1N35_005675 [Gossypium stocksii]
MGFLGVLISWSSEEFGEEFTDFILSKVVHEGFSRGVGLVQKEWCSRGTIGANELHRLLLCHGIQRHNYDFKSNIPSGENELSTISGLDHGEGRPSFYLSLYILEVGFHLLMSDFICKVLRYYGFALGQLSSAL